MIKEILGIIKEGIIEKIAERVQEDKEKRLLGQQFADYLDREYAFFEESSFDVNFDYQGLIDFLIGSFISNEIDRVLTINQEQAERAEETIIVRAIAAANAMTDSSKDTVKRIVKTLVRTVRLFYLEKVSRSDMVALSEVTASLSSKIDQNTEMLRTEIKDSGPMNLVQEEIQRLMLEEMKERAEKRKREELTDKIRKCVYDSVAIRTGHVANMFGITNQEAFDILRELAMEGKVVPAGQMRIDNPSLAWLWKTK